MFPNGTCERIVKAVADAVRLIETAKSTRKNVWIKAGQASIYIRVTERYIGNRRIKSLDIANIDFNQWKGNGLFSMVLPYLEELAESWGRVLYIENVLEDRFQHFFETHGYSADGHFLSVSYFKEFS